MDLYELIPHINTSENAIQFLRDRGILRSEPPICTHPLCVREMTEVNTGRRRASGGDDKVWRCPAHKNKKLEISAAGTLNLILYTICCIFVVFSHIYFSFRQISKSWHFRGKRWHILVQRPQIEKIMSDSDSAAQITPRNALSKEKNFWKKNFFWDHTSLWLPFGRTKQLIQILQV